MHSPAIHAAIARVIHDYAHGIDHRDWSLLRSVFADSVDIDFSSWSGTAAATMPADVWVEALRSITGSFDATQHLISNLRLEGGDDDLTGTTEVQAQHWFSAPTMAGFDRPSEPAACTLGGTFTNRYLFRDDGWKILSCTFAVRWRTGDETLFALARQRS